jgi:hypothetical protein
LAREDAYHATSKEITSAEQSDFETDERSIEKQDARLTGIRGGWKELVEAVRFSKNVCFSRKGRMRTSCDVIF